MAAVLEEHRRRQHGVVTRAQACASGLSAGAVRARVENGRWQRLHPGVYATFSGPVPHLAKLWAAVLAAGPEAILSHQSAAELHGLANGVSGSARGAGDTAIHITVPHGRKVAPRRGIVIHRSRYIDELRHPVRVPPQTRVEETVVDLTQTARGLEEAYAWMAQSVNQGLTTAQHLLEAIRKRPRLRQRRLLREGLGDVAAGCRSVLELSYVRKVERAHRLPVGERQARVTHAGRRNYLDVLYRQYRTVVELDGEAAHPYHERFRDRRRDNAVTVAGNPVLRYGTADVEERPCEVAREVGAVLRRAGWSDPLRRCSAASCSIPSPG